MAVYNDADSAAQSQMQSMGDQMHGYGQQHHGTWDQGMGMGMEHSMQQQMTTDYSAQMLQSTDAYAQHSMTGYDAIRHAAPGAAQYYRPY